MKTVINVGVRVCPRRIASAFSSLRHIFHFKKGLDPTSAHRKPYKTEGESGRNRKSRLRRGSEAESSYRMSQIPVLVLILVSPWAGLRLFVCRCSSRLHALYAYRPTLTSLVTVLGLWQDSQGKQYRGRPTWQWRKTWISSLYVESERGACSASLSFPIEAIYNRWNMRGQSH